MASFQSLEENIKINIFKYVERPLNLALTCSNWSAIAKNPVAKAEWLIAHCGKAHALFHAVRLGPTFIDIEICDALMKRKVIISKCFIEKLLTHFGQNDQKLIELKMEHNVDQFDTTDTSSWASNLPLPVFNYLLIKGYDNPNEDSSLKVELLELFHTWKVGEGRREDQYLNRAYLPLIG